MQMYSDENREAETYALPDVEVFYWDMGDAEIETGDGIVPCQAGYYFWFCFPGCMPESDPYGPYESEEDAIEAMKDMVEE